MVSSNRFKTLRGWSEQRNQATIGQTGSQRNLQGWEEDERKENMVEILK